MAKLLLVDDDEALRRLMRLELSDTYEILDSGEPEQGLALALEHRPDAVLLDLRMPKYSGFELLQTYTSFSHTQRTPVVIVTGEAGGQTKEHCIRLGAAGYFEKPIDFDALRICLRNIVRPQRYTPRTEVRLQLRVQLKLRSADSQGKMLEEVAITENVSLSGFYCACAAEFPTDCMVDVYLTTGGQEYVGKAKVIQASAKGTPVRHYRFCFIEKTGPWVLQ
jgi:DNA-binding response OmpR family regulator